nr:hypothetical protein [uncultured Pseudomonas sp.]
MKIGSITTFGNGKGGVFIDGKSDVTIDTIKSFNNAGDGVVIGYEQCILANMGIPQAFKPEILEEIIQKITPQSNQKEVEVIIQEKFPAQTILETGANISTIASNLLTVACNPALLSNFSQILKNIIT